MLQNATGIKKVELDYRPGSSSESFINRITNDSGPLKEVESLLIRKIPRWKRAFDIIGSLISIVFFLPLLVAIAVAIKLTSKGPVIYKQLRVGPAGIPFSMYKFRSMVDGADCKMKDLMEFSEYDGYAFKMKNDPRITKLGCFLRRWSLDELPQLFNVLIGHMSLVGPRPLILAEAEALEGWHRTREHIKPGITCIWQVWGRHERDYNQRMRMDIMYINRLSFFLDLKILLMTIPAILSRRGAY